MLHQHTAGFLFGATLTASGVYLPSVILAQMRFQDFHMLQTFLTASAISAIAILAAKRTNMASCPPKKMSKLSWFPYDGNLLGGLLLGVGMTLTGACPGTVLVQAGAGVKSGVPALVGGLFGGAVYPFVDSFLQNRAAKNQIQQSIKQNQPGRAEKTNAKKSEIFEHQQEQHTALTIPAIFSLPEILAIATFVALCALIVSVTDFLTPSSYPGVHPILGGLLIGVAQLATLLLTRKPVAISGCYGQFIDLFSSQNSGTEALAFAEGIMAGGAAYSWVTGNVIEGRGGSNLLDVGIARSLLGGAVMVLGARMAGGCTSGHGISGLSGLSLASFVTVGACFAGGMGVAALL